MLKFCSLYSGSSGNCLFVSSNNTKVLIDCGTSCKKICDALASIDSSIEEIDAILVTHEHSDHVQSLGMVSKKYNIPIYIIPFWEIDKITTARQLFQDKYLAKTRWKNDEEVVNSPLYKKT